MRESAISMTLLVAASIAFYIYASDYIDMVDAYNKATIAQNNAVLRDRAIEPVRMQAATDVPLPAPTSGNTTTF